MRHGLEDVEASRDTGRAHASVGARRAAEKQVTRACEQYGWRKASKIPVNRRNQRRLQISVTGVCLCCGGKQTIIGYQQAIDPLVGEITVVGRPYYLHRHIQNRAAPEQFTHPRSDHRRSTSYRGQPLSSVLSDEGTHSTSRLSALAHTRR